MLMTGVPTEPGFERMVRLNQLQDCPITHKDIKIARFVLLSGMHTLSVLHGLRYLSET